MEKLPLDNKIVLITGAAKRIGHALSLACAVAGADVFIHYGQSEMEAIETQNEIISLGRRAWIKSADLSRPQEVSDLLINIWKIGPLYALINNAAVFQPLTVRDTTLTEWEHHLAVNLTAPFLLSQGFASRLLNNETGRIVNILDWRAIRPGADHLPYSVSKAALVALTQSLAISLAPNITVNGLALGAILPPTDQQANPDLLNFIPAGRWGRVSEVQNALIFLLTGPAYITGEIIHLDGGRHLI